MAHVVRTLREIAEHFEVRYDTVRKEWRPHMPGRPGRWDLDEIAAWKLERSRDPGAKLAAGGSDHARKLAAEARIKEAEAAKKERENRLADGEYVLRADVERFQSEAFTAFRDALLQVPIDVSPSFPAKKREQLTEELTSRLRMVLSSLVANGKAGLNDVTATGKPGRKRRK